MASIVAAMTPAMAAQFEPPLQALRHQNYNLISAERLDDQVTDGKIWVKVIERLQGDTTSPEQIDLIVQSGDAEKIVPGVRYLLYYSDVERANFKVRKEVRNPDRRRVLHTEGADPAVFPDTPEMRNLLSPGHKDVEQGSGYRDLVIQGLQSEYPGLVDLWSAEWAIGSRFAETTAAEIGIFKAVIHDSTQRPSARVRLLATAEQWGNSDESQWFASSAIQILGEVNPSDLAETAGLSELIYASLRVARKYPDESGVEQLAKWLGSTPPLAESAALALRAVSPKAEQQAIENILSRDDVPEATRDFLNGHIRRLKLAQDRSG